MESLKVGIGICTEIRLYIALNNKNFIMQILKAIRLNGPWFDKKQWALIFALSSWKHLPEFANHSL